MKKPFRKVKIVAKMIVSFSNIPASKKYFLLFPVFCKEGLTSKLFFRNLIQVCKAMRDACENNAKRVGVILWKKWKLKH